MREGTAPSGNGVSGATVRSKSRHEGGERPLPLLSRPCFESSLGPHCQIHQQYVRGGTVAMKYMLVVDTACREYTIHENTRPCSAKAFSAATQIANSFSSSRRRQTSCTATGPPTLSNGE
jgi:hypothetical protein